MPKKHDNLFGTEVKKKLLDLRLNQTEFSELTGIGYKYLGHILTGYRKGYKYRKIICDKLGLNYDKLKNAG